MKRRRSNITKDPIKFLCFIISISCTLILCITVLKLHEIPVRTTRTVKIDSSVGKLGEMVIQMLPQDLGFTLFLPSERAFNRDLGLTPNDLMGEKMNDTYVILTRVLGFAAVPRTIQSEDVGVGMEIDYDSISGYTLYISKDIQGGSNLIVNRIASEMVDLRRNGEIVVHVMDGVIMDSEFEQSVRPDTNDQDDD